MRAGSFSLGSSALGHSAAGAGTFAAGAASSGLGGSGSAAGIDLSTLSDAEIARRGRAALVQFLRTYRAYDLMPESGKVVVFDTDVPIRLAFYALVEHDTAAAPLWDTARGRFAGMLTASDLCDIMRIFHVPGTQSTAAALAEFTIATWRSYASSTAAAAAAAAASADGGSVSGSMSLARSPASSSRGPSSVHGSPALLGLPGGALLDGMHEDGAAAVAADGSTSSLKPGRRRTGTGTGSIDAAEPSGGRSRSASRSSASGAAALSSAGGGRGGGGGGSGMAEDGDDGDHDDASPGGGNAGDALLLPHDHAPSGSAASAATAAAASGGSAPRGSAGVSKIRTMSASSAASAGAGTAAANSGLGGGGKRDGLRPPPTPGGGPAPAPASSAPDQRRPAGTPARDLVAIDPEDDLLTVVLKLRRYGIHHMPVLGPEADGVGGVSSNTAASASLHAGGAGGGNGGAGLSVLAVLSYKSLLEHLVSKFTDADSVALLEQPLLALGVGSFGADILVVPETASVVSVLHVLAERRVSSVPVVAADGSGVLVDVYSREDVAFLANDPTLMVLDAPVGDVRRAQISMVSGWLGGCCDAALSLDAATILHPVALLLVLLGLLCELHLPPCFTAASIAGFTSLSPLLLLLSLLS